MNELQNYMADLREDTDKIIEEQEKLKLLHNEGNDIQLTAWGLHQPVNRKIIPDTIKRAKYDERRMIRRQLMHRAHELGNRMWWEKKA